MPSALLSRTGPQQILRRRRPSNSSHVEGQTENRLRVLELGQTCGDLPRGPPDALDLLVRIGIRGTYFDVLGEEEMHPLPAKAGRRVEGCDLAPAPAAQTGLLLQFALVALERGLALFERAGRQFEQLLACGLAPLTHECHVAFAVEGDDGARPLVLDDLALVLAPLLERHVDELAVVDGSR